MSRGLVMRSLRPCHLLYLLLLNAVVLSAWELGICQNQPTGRTGAPVAPLVPAPATAPSTSAAHTERTGTGSSGVGSVPASDTSLRLGTGDLLEISVYNVPELATKARVSNNGDVYLPLIDYVHVGGLTAE